MALIPYTHPTTAPSSRSTFSASSSSKPTPSFHSRPSSYTIRPPPTSTHSRDRRPIRTFSSSSNSSNNSSNSNSSSAATSISSYTSISTRTFGTYSRPGYAPGQAPHDYFYNEEVREEWDCAPVDGKGRRVRRGSRVSGRGSAGSGGSGVWSGSGGDVPFSGSSFFERGGGGDVGFEGRRDSGSSASARSGSGSGSRSLRYVDDGRGRDEEWENDTVSPADSISQVSAPSSTRRSGVERGFYPQSRSGRPCGLEDGMLGLRAGSSHGSRISGSGIGMANGRLVRVEAPGWA